MKKINYTKLTIHNKDWISTGVLMRIARTFSLGIGAVTPQNSRALGYLFTGGGMKRSKNHRNLAPKNMLILWLKLKMN